jgi:hypothetical protein
MVPNRLIREGLMESEAMLSVPLEARWLFVIIMLSADDLGLFEATEFKLARRADINRDLGATMMQLLADVDLVRFYEVDGKRFGFIPKFQQRVQIQNARHPIPPRFIFEDDEDASSKFNKLAIKTTVGAPVGSGCATDGQRSEDEVEVLQDASHPRPRGWLPDCPSQQFVALYHEVLPELPSVRVIKANSTRAKRIVSFWRWILTSTKTDGARRATNAEEALAWLRGYFERARQNDFLMGRTRRSEAHAGWECDLDFLLTEKGMKHVIERTKDAA